MKFGVAWIALAAAIASADDVSVNSNQPQILNLMSRDLVAAMSYLPASVIGALMLGNGPLPTDAAALLDLASGMPDEERQSVSSLYDDFIAKAGTMLPTASATSESSSSPTATDESTDEESDLSEDSSDSESSGDDESSGSSEDEDESSDKSDDDDDNDKSSDEDSDLDSDTSGAGAVRSFGAAAIAAIAVAAFF